MAKRIVITGASSAIGQAIARRLANPADRVILHGLRNAQACQPLLKDWGGGAEIRAVDLGDRDQLAAFCAELRQMDVDILVNAAACNIPDLLPNQNAADIDAMIDVNIRALAALCGAVLPRMMVRRRGVIVNLSSVAATRGNRGQAVYAGTKGFAESFTRSLAAEYGGRGIRVNAVAPGAIDSGKLKELLSYAADEVHGSTVTKGLGAPDDVAAAVAFLCSDDARFINGKILAVDGGFCRGV
jgi:3-oxoacyl-[acyl-carrier protein] reductase